MNKSQTVQSAKQILIPLISLRFFFALRVFGNHLAPLLNGKSEIYESLSKYIFEVPFGVSFFYILSGFILSYVYQDKIVTQSISIKDFYISRFARIYPLHIITFLLILPIAPEFYNPTNYYGWLIKIATQLTLTQSFIPKESIYFSFNAPSWSLSNALFFYLIFPFAIRSFYRLKQNKVFRAAVICMFILLPFVMINTNQSLQHWLYYINPVIRSFDFIIGILLFHFHQIIIGRVRLTKLSLTVLEISTIFVFALFLYYHNLVPEVIKYSYYTWLPLSLIILVFSFQKGYLSDILNNRLLITLGKSSFGIYLFHRVVIKYFTICNDKYLFIENGFAIVAITLTLTILVSYLSSEYIEKYWSKRIKTMYYGLKRKF
ncbi:acyltransferase family protein [Carboxylicivirga linearis]|uniref:Acyltransferase n=1 Tax=Carboxylicivirga linearis TaxID=1628157 RepID=A0ABS5JTK3_9BACT|nr:acyltransferase [Carboxylicivirga linearis]MBS2098230.1 acyltransferase [Carboxylicivirga linearis]